MNFENIRAEYEKILKIFSTFNKLRVDNHTKKDLLQTFPLSKESLKKYLEDMEKETSIKKLFSPRRRRITKKTSYLITGTQLLDDQLNYIGKLTLKFVIKEFSEIFVDYISMLFPHIALNNLKETINRMNKMSIEIDKQSFKN